MQKYVELANDTNQNWLMQPNCIDQLRNFLNEKNKYLNDYEKNSSLKFCSPIHIPKNDAIKSINEFSKKNSVINTTDHEKFIEYIIKRSGERINEKERKKKFKVEEEMMKVLKKYLKSCRSSVKQSSLKQKNAQKIVDFQIISSVDMIVKKKQIQNYETNKSSKVEHHISRSKDDEKLINIAAKLKKLKEVNVQKFNEVLKKFQSIKIHQNAYYY